MFNVVSNVLVNDVQKIHNMSLLKAVNIIPFAVGHFI